MPQLEDIVGNTVKFLSKGGTFYNWIVKPVSISMLALQASLFSAGCFNKDGGGITEPDNTPPRIEQLTINPNGMPLPYDANIEVIYSDDEKNADLILYGTHPDSLISTKVSSQSSSKIPVTIKKPTVTYYVVVVDSKNAKSKMENATATGQYQPPQWHGLPAKIEVYEDMSLDSLKLKGIDLSQHLSDPLFQQNLAISMTQSYERLSPWELKGNLLVPAGPLLQDSSGVNTIRLVATNPKQFADTASLDVIVKSQGDVEVYVFDMLAPGVYEMLPPKPPLLQDKSTLAINNLEMELLKGEKKIQLPPGRYNVNVVSDSIYNGYLVVRRLGECTNLDQRHRGFYREGKWEIPPDEESYIDVETEDITRHIYVMRKQPIDFLKFLRLVADDFDPQGIQRFTTNPRYIFDSGPAITSTNPLRRDGPTPTQQDIETERYFVLNELPKFLWDVVCGPTVSPTFETPYNPEPIGTPNTVVIVANHSPDFPFFSGNGIHSYNPDGSIKASSIYFRVGRLTPIVAANESTEPYAATSNTAWPEINKLDSLSVHSGNSAPRYNHNDRKTGIAIRTFNLNTPFRPKP